MYIPTKFQNVSQPAAVLLYFVLLQNLKWWRQSFLPRDAHSAKRGIAIVSRPSVCLSIRPSVTLTYRGHIGWTSSNLITQIISLGSSLLGATTSAI